MPGKNGKPPPNSIPINDPRMPKPQPERPGKHTKPTIPKPAPKPKPNK